MRNMRQKKLYKVITFRTTTEAMAMESECGECGIPGRLIPVPREITAGCGLAWRIGMQEYEEYEQQIKILPMEFEQIAEVWI